jgi:UDP-N-acetylmuramyl pentapeptide phosphotransferase/UDP-N-acetylglucosamine-1-phosphate transferase
MRLVIAFAVGYLGARLAWLAARPSFGSPMLARENYRGRSVPTAAGVVIPVAVFAIEAGRVVAGASGIGPDVGLTEPWLLVLLAVSGFALLGAIDDLIGSAAHRGFRGHLRELLRGRPTTGALKLVGGACIALAVVAPLAASSPDRLFVDAAIVALAANVGNLLDRAPGRAIKGSLVGFAALAAATGFQAVLAPVAAVVGAGMGLFLDDLHEHLMLGDSGSNVLGVVLGLGVVLAAGPAARNLVLVVLVAINATGELVSFSAVIDAVPPLRLLDRAGRRP